MMWFSASELHMRNGNDNQLKNNSFMPWKKIKIRFWIKKKKNLKRRIKNKKIIASSLNYSYTIYLQTQKIKIIILRGNKLFNDTIYIIYINIVSICYSAKAITPPDNWSNWPSFLYLCQFVTRIRMLLKIGQQQPINDHYRRIKIDRACGRFVKRLLHILCPNPYYYHLTVMTKGYLRTRCSLNVTRASRTLRGHSPACCITTDSARRKTKIGFWLLVGILIENGYRILGRKEQAYLMSPIYVA